MRTMNPSNRRSTLLHFRLLDLPVELQCVIFGYVLFTDSTLRRASEARHYGDVVLFSGTNILQVSSRIKKETLPIFYQVNHFHYEQVEEDVLHIDFVYVHTIPSIFLRSLHMMRHISIDPIQMQPYGRKWEDGRGQYALEDRHLANILVEIERHAPNLRTLALHFAPFASRYLLHSPFLLAPVENRSIHTSVVSALCRLRARVRRLSLVYFGDFPALEELRSNIAPLKDWTARTLEYWPVTISPILIKYINVWQDPPHVGLETRIWDIYHRPELQARAQGR